MSNSLQDRETIITLLDLLTDANVCSKSENNVEEGDVEYDFTTKENYCYFREAARNLESKCDFSIQTYTDEEDHTHNLSIRLPSLKEVKI